MGNAMADLNDFLAEQPMSTPVTCPFDPMCFGPVRRGSSSTTLIGWSGLDENSNHRATKCNCVTHGDFFHEEQGRYHWYTRDGVAVLGRSSCFEPVTYHHAACGGVVKRTVVHGRGLSCTRCGAIFDPEVTSG